MNSAQPVFQAGLLHGVQLMGFVETSDLEQGSYAEPREVNGTLVR